MADFSSYSLVSRIGQGGMAEVFKAVKSGPDGFSKTVALKKILPLHSDQARFIKMLSTEAKINSYLNHPNIVQILDFFEENGQYCMVLEFVDGKNLKEILNACKQNRILLPWQACLYIALQTLKALHYAHQKEGPQGPLDIIHRDVSPHNILVSYQGEVKLSDFGIARAQIERDETASGVLKGKYRYVSPEQILNAPATASSDLFSLGVTLFEMLGGEHPFGESQEYQTLQKIVDKPHTSLLTINPSLRPEISHAVDQALQKDPVDRYFHAKDMYDDLMDIQDPQWKTDGQELLHELLTNLIPLDERVESPVEKTTQLPNQFTTKHSLLNTATIGSGLPKDIRLWGLLMVAAIGFGAWLAFHKPTLEKQPSPSITESKITSEPITENPSQKISIDSKTEPSRSITNDKPKSPAKTGIAKAPTSPVEAKKPMGELVVTGPKGTHVYINGRPLGDLPFSTIEVPPGSYNILFLHDQLGRRIKNVSIAQKQKSKVSWD